MGPATIPIKSKDQASTSHQTQEESALPLPRSSSLSIMNASAVCLSIILVGLLFSQTSPAPIGADTTVCCFSYTLRKLPQSHVKDYFYTSSKCSQPAVVFITRKDREVCANPDARWVKEYVNTLELQ